MRTASKIAVAVLTIALAAGLTACSGGQSVADACKIINTEGQKIVSDANGAMSEVGSDPSAAASTLKKVSDQLSKVGDKVTNSEVKEAWDGFTSAYADVATVIDTVAKDVKADPSKATDAMTKLTDASKSITDAGTKLQKVCS